MKLMEKCVLDDWYRAESPLSIVVWVGGDVDLAVVVLSIYVEVMRLKQIGVTARITAKQQAVDATRTLISKLIAGYNSSSRAM